MTTQEQIDSFHQFATAKLANGGTAKSVDELYDEWRSENVSDDEFSRNVAAIQASIDDLNNGVLRRDAHEVVQEAREQFKLRDDA